MNRPRLRQVADIAEVSEPTVSRVLNGRVGVAPKTRQRVVDALNELGFTEIPEPTETRRNVIGIICGEMLNPVFPTLLHHLSSEFGRSGRLTSVTLTDKLNPEQRCIDELLASAVDGIIFIGGHHAEVDGRRDHYQQLTDSGVPMVFVNGTATDIDVPHVRCDEGAGARKAIAHLAQLGHRQIGCLLGSPQVIPTHRFVEGYRQTLVDWQLEEMSGAIVNTSFTLEGGRAGATRLWESGITGILAGNDLMALGAIHAALKLGLRVPDDVSVVGYDGTDITALTNPSLTTLRQPYEDMARLVGAAIVDEIDGTTNYRDQYVFEPELLSRGSSGPPSPAGD